MKRIEMEDETLKINIGKLNELIKLDNIEADVIKRIIPQNYPVIGFGFVVAGSFGLGVVFVKYGVNDLLFYNFMNMLVPLVLVLFGALALDAKR
ncbi:MAG: hypothetical protein M0R17_07160 [Candidatus Omnitrophica bacterium]|jgi:hypothetical protein|nr:hypothetical protein [Candidatus Omnitrophota bacterium]